MLVNIFGLSFLENIFVQISLSVVAQTSPNAVQVYDREVKSYSLQVRETSRSPWYDGDVGEIMVAQDSFHVKVLLVALLLLTEWSHHDDRILLGRVKKINSFLNNSIEPDNDWDCESKGWCIYRTQNRMNEVIERNSILEVDEDIDEFNSEPLRLFFNGWRFFNFVRKMHFVSNLCRVQKYIFDGCDDFKRHECKRLFSSYKHYLNFYDTFDPLVDVTKPLVARYRKM